MIQDVLDLDLDSRQDPARAIVQAQSSPLLVDTIDAAWRTGFDVITDAAFFQLVSSRLVEPTSMSDAVRVLAELGIEPAHRRSGGPSRHVLDEEAF